MGRLGFKEALEDKVYHTNNHTNKMAIPKYSKPKICHFDYDLSREWYIYYSYVHPTKLTPTGRPKRVRQPNVYCKSKRFNNVKDRLRHVKKYQKALHEMLEDGYSPYKSEKKKRSNTIKFAFQFALKFKKTTMSENTYKDYEGKVNRFLNFYNKSNSLNNPITELKRSDVNQYLNKLQIDTSIRNRNNMRVALFGIFKVLTNNDFIVKNIIEGIPIIKTQANRNKVFKDSKVDEIFNYLKSEDPVLLLFIKFVSYNFLRPVEVCRISFENIDFEKRLIIFKSKTKEQKIKIIPEILWDEIKNLKWKPKEFLFTPFGLCNKWETKENDRRNYFSRRFKKVVKDKFKLSKDYTMYGFRHTFITRLYNQLLKEFTQEETFDKLTLITGHQTRDALLKYLREIDVVLPEDYSKYLK